jgi:hypothetical protein
MKPLKITLLFALTLTLAVCNYCTVELKDNPDKGLNNCYGSFSKYVDIFGIRVLGRSDAPDCWVQ